MVTVADALSLRPALDEYVDEFASLIRTVPSQRHFNTYVAGQVGPLPRKNVEAIALAAGEPPRTLQQFLGLHKWDEEGIAEALRHRVRDRHAGAGGILIVDETGCPKSGSDIVGVQRQYCGRTGKVDNCVMTVGLGYVRDGFYCLLDSDLYLPEHTWATDKKLRDQAGVPDDVQYRPKWVIACELVERAKADGVPFSWVTGDELYGRCAAFRKRIAATGAKYIVEIPSDVCGWTALPKIDEPGSIPEGGRRPLKKSRVANGEKKARQVDKLWNRGGPSRANFRVKDTTKGPQVWEVRWTRFYAQKDKIPGPEECLIIARNILTGEVKYFLSNAVDGIPIGTLLSVAFSRWYIEKTFKESKSRVGFDHFEVRTYRSVTRHLILSAVSLLFLVEQSLRLQEKSAGWTVPKIREAIELQLDDEMPLKERKRRLEKLIRNLKC